MPRIIDIPASHYDQPKPKTEGAATARRRACATLRAHSIPGLACLNIPSSVLRAAGLVRDMTEPKTAQRRPVIKRAVDLARVQYNAEEGRLLVHVSSRYSRSGLPEHRCNQFQFKIRGPLPSTSGMVKPFWLCLPMSGSEVAEAIGSLLSLASESELRPRDQSPPTANKKPSSISIALPLVNSLLHPYTTVATPGALATLEFKLPLPGVQAVHELALREPLVEIGSKPGNPYFFPAPSDQGTSVQDTTPAGGAREKSDK